MTRPLILWTRRIYRTARWLAPVLTVGASVVVVSALVGSTVAAGWARLAAAFAAALLLPVALRWLLRRRVARSCGHRLKIGGGWMLAGYNLCLLAVLCLGFCDATGRALRRRGDWFVGESDGLVARLVRASVTRAGRWMERFDLPDELPVDVRVALGRTWSIPVHRQLPPDERPPDEAVVDPAQPGAPRWYHPLAGPRRKMPPNAACRFGAVRPGRRPPECELGHCGVDLAGPVGTPVFAIADGVVLKAVRNERWGGRAGRYVKLAHEDGLVRSYYVHLDRIRAGLKTGSLVRGGEQIGTIGLTGVKRSAPHLHFGISVREGEAGQRGYRYVDPEPLLAWWRLPVREEHRSRSNTVASRAPISRAARASRQPAVRYWADRQ